MTPELTIDGDPEALEHGGVRAVSGGRELEYRPLRHGLGVLYVLREPTAVTWSVANAKDGTT